MNANIFHGSADATLKDCTAAFQKTERAQFIREGRYTIVEDKTDRFRHLSLLPTPTGHLEVLLRSDYYILTLPKHAIEYLGLRDGDDVGVLSRLDYLTLWKHDELKMYISSMDLKGLIASLREFGIYIQINLSNNIQY